MAARAEISKIISSSSAFKTAGRSVLQSSAVRHTRMRLALLWFLATVIAGAQPREIQQPWGASPEPAIPLKRLPLDILHDQKTVWTFTGKAVRGQHWKPVFAIGLITAGLVALDPHTEPYFHNNP